MRQTSPHSSAFLWHDRKRLRVLTLLTVRSQDPGTASRFSSSVEQDDTARVTRRKEPGDGKVFTDAETRAEHEPQQAANLVTGQSSQKTTSSSPSVVRSCTREGFKK